MQLLRKPLPRPHVGPGFLAVHLHPGWWWRSRDTSELTQYWRGQEALTTSRQAEPGWMASDQLTAQEHLALPAALPVVPAGHRVLLALRSRDPATHLRVLEKDDPV